MKIVHWSLSNGSGLRNVAEDLSKAECAIGLDSLFIPTDKIVDGKVDKTEWERGMDADVHVAHSHIPDDVRNTKGKNVFIPHGTPEVCFQSSALKPSSPGAWGMSLYWLKEADASVTFWPRHKYIWDSMCDRGKSVDLVPLGVDKSFWKPTKSWGKYAGEPSFLTNENSHQIKWCYDIAIAWPEVYNAVRNAKIHFNYIPTDQYHAFYPLFYKNGAIYSAYIGGVLNHEQLRNAFCSIDYYINPVIYGDFNRVGLEAKACGCKVISYAGNPYADYWLALQDQRSIASELTAIAKGEREPRQTEDVPDIKDTAEAMIKIYERICNKSNPVKSRKIKVGDNGDVQGGIETDTTYCKTVED